MFLLIKKQTLTNVSPKIVIIDNGIASSILNCPIKINVGINKPPPPPTPPIVVTIDKKKLL